MMNKKLPWFALALVAGVLAGVWADLLAQQAPALPAMPPARVAVCDVMNLLDHYVEAVDLMNDLQKHRDGIQAEDTKRKERIQEMAKMLRDLKPGAQEYRNLRDEIEQATIELKNWEDLQKARDDRKQHETMQSLYAKIRKGVAEEAAQRGVDLVLYVNHRPPPTMTSQQMAVMIESQKVLYSRPELDITEAVLGRMNKAYEAKNP